MMKLIYSLFLLLVVSCSSTQEKVQVEEFSPEIMKEFEWVENSNFIKEGEVPFNPRLDEFPEEISESDSLVKESAARLPEAKLEDLESSKDPITQIVGLCYQGEFSDAMLVFKKEFSKYSQNPSFWNQMGTCHLLQGNLRKALLFYNKSRDLNKNYSPPINNIGVLYLKTGEPQKALAAFEKAMDVNRFSQTPMFNIGNLYLRYGLADKGLQIFKNLYAKKPTDLDVVAGFATALLMNGDAAEAVNVYAKLPKEYMENPKIGANYAVALAMTKNMDKARDVLSDLDSTKSSNIEAYVREVRKALR